MPLLAKSQKRKSEVKKSLILHVGSDRVTGVLAVFSDKERPHIVEIIEKPVSFEAREDELKFMKQFREAAVVVSETLVKRGHFIPEHVYVSLESPWYSGQTRTVYYSKKEPFAFSHNLAHTLIDQDFEKYKTTAEKAFGERLQALDKSVISIKLNGYATPEPYGKKGREASISYYASLAPKVFMDTLCGDLEKVLRGRIKFFSSSVALSGAFYMTLEHQKKLLLISIGGEVTELLYLENGILMNMGTFPSGRNFLLRTLGNELRQNPLEIFSLLSLCRDGRAHENVTKKVESIVARVENTWRKHLRKGVHEVVGPAQTNTPVMIIGSPDTLSWFKKMINNEHITKGSLETAVSAKEWSGIVTADFFKHRVPSKGLPPLILSDCLYIYGING